MPMPAQVPVLPALHQRAAVPVPNAAHDIAAARLGQAVHRVLEWAGQPVGAGASGVDFDLAAAGLAAARAFGLPPAAQARVAQIAGQILASPPCARFFSGPALRWAGNEVPVAADGESLRVDRLVALTADDAAVDGTHGANLAHDAHDANDASAARPALTWWVLDYKLHSAPAALPAYRAQLQRYVLSVQALQPGDTVRGAFITALGELVEL